MMTWDDLPAKSLTRVATLVVVAVLLLGSTDVHSELSGLPGLVTPTPLFAVSSAQADAIPHLETGAPLTPGHQPAQLARSKIAKALPRVVIPQLRPTTVAGLEPLPSPTVRARLWDRRLHARAPPAS